MAGKYKKNLIPMKKGTVAVYASPRVSEALHEVTADMNVYQGVRLGQLLEAVYEQGKKDGARNAFSAAITKMGEAQKLVPHRNPGKPQKT